MPGIVLSFFSYSSKRSYFEKQKVCPLALIAMGAMGLCSHLIR